MVQAEFLLSVAESVNAWHQGLDAGHAKRYAGEITFPHGLLSLVERASVGGHDGYLAVDDPFPESFAVVRLLDLWAGCVKMTFGTFEHLVVE